MGAVDFRVSEVALLRTVAVGIVLLVVLQALRMGYNRLRRRWRSRLPLARLLPILEAMVGLLYVSWALGSILGRGVYHSAALFMVFVVATLLLTWFAARDWVAGIVLKVELAYEAGQRIRCGDIEGTIRSVGHLSLEVELSHGERIRIPYSRMSGEIRGLRSGDAPREHHRFQIDVEGGADVAASIRRLREAILNSPWSALDREPQIRVLAEEPTHTRLEAVVYAPEATQAASLEMDIRQLLGVPSPAAPESASTTGSTTRDG